MTGDCHAGICGSRGVRFPPATRLQRIAAEQMRPSFQVKTCGGRLFGGELRASLRCVQSSCAARPKATDPRGTHKRNAPQAAPGTTRAPRSGKGSRCTRRAQPQGGRRVGVSNRAEGPNQAVEQVRIGHPCGSESRGPEHGNIGQETDHRGTQ